MIQVPITKVNQDLRSTVEDTLAIEEPLEIRLSFGPSSDRTTRNISVTMRTPGEDGELATGFLFTEGIITQKSDLASVHHRFIACMENKENVIQVELTEIAVPKLPDADRNFYTTSSCGVCGKGSIAAIRTVSVFNELKDPGARMKQSILVKLPDLLRDRQQIFDATGGLHACALFDLNGNIILVREDVGRHNALDKLIGAALERDLLPLHNNVLLLSGRASFELIQKAAMAGLKIVAAIGAPSSLAVELATEFDITLVGFLRKQRFNIYTAASRISNTDHED
jgi:FdhD protein